MSTQDARDLRVIADSLRGFAEKYPAYNIEGGQADKLERISTMIEENHAKRQCLHDHFHVKKWHKVFREKAEGPATKVIDSESKSWFISLKTANVYAVPADARAVAYALWRALDKQIEEATT